jgi:DNA-binding response OmpR family regulator
MRALVVEDDRALARVLAQGLREEGWTVTVALDGAEGMRLLGSTEPAFDVVVLDRMLPRLDGLEFVAQLRQRGEGIPVLMLTARTELESRVQGFDAGVDDYLPKPFEFDELVARLKAIYRRSRGFASNVQRFGALAIDTVARTATRAENDVVLSGKEWSVLEVLLANRGRVLSRQQILDHVYAGSDAVGSNVVEVYVAHLRRKLGGEGVTLQIRTRRGLGYILEESA